MRTTEPMPSATKTDVERVAAVIRQGFPGDGNQKAAAEAVFIAFHQAGSLVRITVTELEHTKCVTYLMKALDDLNAVDWRRMESETASLIAPLIEIKNGSAIEFKVRA